MCRIMCSCACPPPCWSLNSMLFKPVYRRAFLHLLPIFASIKYRYKAGEFYDWVKFCGQKCAFQIGPPPPIPKIDLSEHCSQSNDQGPMPSRIGGVALQNSILSANPCRPENRLKALTVGGGRGCRGVSIFISPTCTLAHAHPNALDNTWWLKFMPPYRVTGQPAHTAPQMSCTQPSLIPCLSFVRGVFFCCHVLSRCSLLHYRATQRPQCALPLLLQCMATGSLVFPTVTSVAV